MNRGASIRQTAPRSGAAFADIYRILLQAYGRQRWWPVTPPAGEVPEYTGGPRNDSQRFEVAVGAVLTQNTAWRNAAKAITNLNRAGALEPATLSAINVKKLAGLIRPAGYYNQKAERLILLARYFLAGEKTTRESLLALHGVGPETADSILLYAFGRPHFVIDAYTRRIFTRLGLVDKEAKYDAVKETFEREIPRNVPLYKEFHALIVEHAKRCCRTKPVCNGCSLLHHCGEAVRIENNDCR